jgi:Zn finger protein HypA/HybF involved in hydrogenase expression
MAKIRIEDIQNELSAEGWKVISTEYVNLDTEMTFECPEGHRVFIPWKKLRTKRECPTCKQKVIVEQGDKVLPKPKGAKRILALD